MENGSTLMVARERAGKSIEDMASAIGVTPRRYEAVERDQGGMSLHHALAACEYLGVAIDDLFHPGRECA